MEEKDASVKDKHIQFTRHLVNELKRRVDIAQQNDATLLAYRDKIQSLQQILRSPDVAISEPQPLAVETKFYVRDALFTCESVLNDDIMMPEVRQLLEMVGMTCEVVQRFPKFARVRTEECVSKPLWAFLGLAKYQLPFIKTVMAVGQTTAKPLFVQVYQITKRGWSCLDVEATRLQPVADKPNLASMCFIFNEENECKLLISPNYDTMEFTRENFNRLKLSFLST